MAAKSEDTASASPLNVELPPRSSKASSPTHFNTKPAKINPLQVLIQLGFPPERAQKALAATGHRGTQIASDWLLAHVNDPTLDQDTPRQYVFYLCPTGMLQDQLQTFWDASKIQIGWNGVHSSFPHMTLTSTFHCPDSQAEELIDIGRKVGLQFQEDFTNDAFNMEKYVSPNFLGLFVGKREEILLRSLSQELSQRVGSTGVQIEATTKAYHVTLAYQFAPEHLDGLGDLSNSVDPGAHCDWELRLYSYEDRIKGKDVFKVLFSHIPREEDELELMIGDYVYVSLEENANSTDGWVVGTSWLTGGTGYLPKNYIQQTAETNAWTLHLSVAMTKNQNPVTPMDVNHGHCRLSLSSTSSVERAKPVVVRSEALDGQSHVDKEVESYTSPKVSPPQKSPKSPLKTPRQVFVVRHGERVDFTFGSWIPFCFDDKGKYKQRDLNMPLSVPHRVAGPQGFLRDCPLSRVGVMQARLLGEALKEAKVNFAHAYCSPSLRCVETCHHILEGMGLTHDIRLNLEYGLFEWLAWYQNAMPDLMTPEEFSNLGYNVEMGYKPFISSLELQDTDETCEEYYSRNFFVTTKGSTNNEI
eukprot:maker-scaffold708_size108518-snap-gene-0.14 protein:Tk11256 transcript:maker-scaffold708_size108518-snap-gene-0.14-mRNA-1 annotation:"protein ubash3a homolog isoform x2"